MIHRRIASPKSHPLDQVLVEHLRAVGPQSHFRLFQFVQGKLSPEEAMRQYEMEARKMKGDPETLYPTLEQKLDKGLGRWLTNKLHRLGVKGKLKYDTETNLWSAIGGPDGGEEGDAEVRGGGDEESRGGGRG